MIEAMFQKLGFSGNEARLYLLLAEMGKSTAQLLAKRAAIPRTTAYSVLEGLVAKGLISEEHKQGTTFFIINQPQALQRVVQREQDALKTKERLVKDLVEQVKPFFKSKFFSLPKIQFFEGNSAVETMLYDFSKEWQRSILQADGTWWGYQDHTFVEHYRPWLEYYWTIKKEQQEIRLLSNESPIEKALKGKVVKRTVKVVPEDYDFSSTIWVCGEYIVLLMTRNEPHYAFQLRDSVFSSNLRLVFKLLWESFGE